MWRADFLLHGRSPSIAAGELGKRSDCEPITGLVMGNQVPGPQCKPRVRSSIVRWLHAMAVRNGSALASSAHTMRAFFAAIATQARW